MNHLEKKCCGKCDGGTWADLGRVTQKICKNTTCPCHTNSNLAERRFTNGEGTGEVIVKYEQPPTPYSVLREKIRKTMYVDGDFNINDIMSHIDEYRENLAKEVEAGKAKHWLTETGEAFNEAKDEDASIIRRT